MNKRQIIYERAKNSSFAAAALRVKVEMGEYKGNSYCQHNSRQAIEEGKATHIVSTLCFIPNSGVNVHFMPIIGAKVVDNTNGYLSKYNEYLMLGFYLPHQLEESPNFMTKLLNKEKEKVLSKLFTPKEREELGITLSDI